MQPIVFIPAVKRLNGGSAASTLNHVVAGNFLSAKVEPYLLSDKASDRRKALKLIKESVGNEDIKELVGLIAISLQRNDDVRLLEESLDIIGAIVKDRLIQLFPGEEPQSPLAAIINRLRWCWRSVQLNAVRQKFKSSNALKSSLLELSQFEDPVIRRKSINFLNQFYGYRDQINYAARD